MCPQLPCVPNSNATALTLALNLCTYSAGCGGCAGCAPPLVTFNQSLDWLRNYSMLADGAPITTFLVGWQGNGHDSLYPGLDQVNQKLGGSTDLARLVASAKAELNATVSYHIDVDISNELVPTMHYEGPHSHPKSPFGAK